MNKKKKIIITILICVLVASNIGTIISTIYYYKMFRYAVSEHNKRVDQIDELNIEIKNLKEKLNKKDDGEYPTYEELLNRPNDFMFEEVSFTGTINEINFQDEEMGLIFELYVDGSPQKIMSCMSLDWYEEYKFYEEGDIVTIKGEYLGANEYDGNIEQSMTYYIDGLEKEDK